ncbi:hypothetical protein [Micropruina sp.]|uniref:hypothetical protein n=1 Tax=Micropruina sp. TaxID=2737536 RepID=UPI0039E3FCC4
MEQPSNTDAGPAHASDEATPGSSPFARATAWRGPGGIRVSVVGLIGVALVIAGILALVMSGNAAFSSGVVVAGFGVLLIDALRAR